MKAVLLSLLVILLTISINYSALAQDSFKVTISSTDKYSGLCKPEKAGVSFKLPVKVESLISDTCTISINTQSSFGIKSEWFQVDKENLTIVKNQTITFTLTVNPPAGTPDGTSEFHLYFDATGKSVANRDFDQNGFTVIVDNSVPSILEFSAPTYGRSSTSLEFTWNAFDQWSDYYTEENDTAGVDGVARYQIVLKNQSNQEVASKSYDANDVPNGHTFNGLASNTQYTAYLTATDVAGNQKTSAGLPATTPPAAPANLTATNTTYCSVTLTWSASPGATSYKVCNSTTSPSTTYTTSNLYYTFSGLSLGSTYNFYIIAVGAGGSSNRSNITTSTLSLPVISGSPTVCSTGQIFTVNNFPTSGYLQWNYSSNLTKSNISSNSAMFYANGSGTGWVEASVNSVCGTDSAQRVSVVVGTPTPTITAKAHLVDGEPITYLFTATPYSNATYSWYVNNTLQDELGNTFDLYVPCRHTATVKCSLTNTCGTSTFSNSSTKAGSCTKGSTYSVSPNPVSTDLTIRESHEQSTSRAFVESSPIYLVQIYDRFGTLVLQRSYPQGTLEVRESIANLPRGVYVVKINEGELQESATIIKE